MIKFWKSAAKGKSGCPVRPPELDTATVSCSSDTQNLINTQISYENDEDLSDVFNKKSKLSLTLHDILIGKKALKYFIQFMESINQHNILKCWLELEDFKTTLTNMSNRELDSHSKINRVKSFDFQSKDDAKMSQRSNWMDSDVFALSRGLRLSRRSASTSSCGNLVDHANNANNYEMFVGDKPYDVSEKAVELFKKYVALEAPHQLDLSDGYRKSVISNICHPEGQIKEDCFKPVQDVVFNKIENNFFSDFLNSPFYIKAQIDILTNDSLRLDDVIHNETILFYFTEYLEQESSSVYLEFLMAVMHFRDNLINANTVSAEQTQADAIVLYDKYFSLQATTPIGFPSDIRLKIENDICREGGPLVTCFDIPYRIVFKTLTKYLKTFLESELYYKYLSEMVHSVDQMGTTNHKSHSDCSSEFSISTQNTLLAMGDPVYRKKKRNHSVPDMTIDSNQLYNADALWQRKKHDGLSLGRVNSLGRFESKFEPDPDKKDRSVLKKMVSRFVPTNTFKVEEEMAWQIAHMIVKDVTDLTMAPPDNEPEDM